ncbi:MAG TPA: glycosyltransferase [Candidatus Paceibacterota bacterium]|nr:glycosyltransferase [Verrucomicrobiota bacterium]HSA08835.1 glycosyltransferase [Candidatus Paceibacterota bacterium]
MRVLAVTNMYPTEEFPGRGVFVQEQIKSLIAAGLSVRVLFVDRLREGPSAYYRMGIRLSGAIEEFEPDLIHVMYGGVMAKQVVQRRYAPPTLVTFHGSDLLGENLSGRVRKLISRYGVWCSKRAAKAADGVVVVARHLLRALPRSVPAVKVHILPCGIDLGRFKPMDSYSCRRQLGWRRDAFHVVFASSNGDPVKRPALAQAAFRQTLRQGIPAELHYLTGVPNSAVPTWLNAGDALLLTSLHEGSPTVVKEALGCGLPVVSVDVGDVAERIEEIKGCHLARPDPADLAHKLSLVYHKRQRLDCRSRLEDISVSNVARQLTGVYELLADKVRSPALAFPNPKPRPGLRVAMPAPRQSARASVAHSS